MDKKRKIIRAIGLVVLFVGIGVFLYPYISQYFYNRNVSKIVANFEANVKDKNNELLEELYQKLVIENQALFEEGQKNLVDPFSYQQTSVNLREYGIEDNIIGYISLPKIEEILPIYLGASEENMKLGAVHLTQTSYPIGGTNTNTVIAAHRGYSKAAMFRNIDKLEIGDAVQIRNFREQLNYRVTEIKIIEPEEINQVLIQEGKDMITLFSCHPYRENRQRYVVYCERV